MRKVQRRRSKFPFPYSNFIGFSTRMFAFRGYRRTRLEKIATDSLVGKGTIYLYVQSKLALFYLVLRTADRPWLLRVPGRLPVPTPTSEMLRGYALHRLEQARRVPQLNLEAPARPLGLARRELRTALTEIYWSLRRNKTAVRLIEGCSGELPALRKIGLDPRRHPAIEPVAKFLEVHRDYLPQPKSPIDFAHALVETLVFFAIYRDWDLSVVDYSRIPDSLVAMLGRGVLRRPRERRRRAESPAIDHAPGECHT